MLVGCVNLLQMKLKKKIRFKREYNNFVLKTNLDDLLVFGTDIAILQAMETLDLETILKRTCVVVQVVQYTVFTTYAVFFNKYTLHSNSHAFNFQWFTYTKNGVFVTFSPRRQTKGFDVGDDNTTAEKLRNHRQQ